MVFTLDYLGNNDPKKAVHVQYKHNHPRPNYIVYISNNVTLKKIFLILS